jgi:hypothetical protein
MQGAGAGSDAMELHVFCLPWKKNLKKNVYIYTTLVQFASDKISALGCTVVFFQNGFWARQQLYPDSLLQKIS